jgi:hypothetical protein
MVPRALLAIALLCGCQDRSLEQLKDVKAEVCACKTAECAEAAMKKVPPVEKKADHRLQAVANEMLACLAKVYLKERPKTDPDEPAPPKEPAAKTP